LPISLSSQQAQSVIPETLVWDGVRLATIRNMVDSIALQSALVLTCRQALNRVGIVIHNTFQDEEDEFQHRLGVLFADNDVRLPEIITESTRHIKACVRKVQGVAGLAQLNQLRIADQTFESNVAKSIKDVLVDNNPILNLFIKRIYKLLLRGLLAQPYAGKLPSYSLQSRAQERAIGALIQEASLLFNHTMRIHAALYSSILGSETIRTVLA
jgi:T-complex protein 11